jgi:putative chitinase
MGVRADGVLGPVTYRALFRRLAAAPVGNDRTDALGNAAAVHFSAYGIDANPRRLVEFLGEALHETGRFVHLRELWGPTPTQQRYEGRRDLGNTQPGDGRRFLGRGIFQLTGRDNYTRAGRALGLPLADQPELAERPDIAVLTACWYWRQSGLSALADAGNSDGVSGRINRGDPNKVALHLPERRAQKARVRALVE